MNKTILFDKGGICVDTSVSAIVENKYAWHDLRKNPNDLPPYRGEGGCVPNSYEMVVMFNNGTVDEITVQGQGWLNDVWKENGTGFIMIATHLTSKKLICVPDHPIEFDYSQLIAWRYIEPFEEDE